MLINMKDFIFGVSTSATQIEGGWDQDGKGITVWDDYSRRGLIECGHTCYTACDSYNRLDEDLALIKKLGVNSYRFSINWARIQPDGKGAVNKKGIAYYNRLIDGLIAIGVKPMVTLFHWDLPITLQKAGGFLNRDIIDRFAAYAKIIAENFGDRVELFTVFNEPLVVLDFLYVRPVGGGDVVRTNQEVFEGVHNLLLCNAAATESLRKYSQKKVQVGLVNCTQLKVPATESPEDIEAARKALFAVGNTVLDNTVTFWDPLIFGKYDKRIIEKFGIDLSFVRPGDMEMIQCKPDYMGYNVYFGETVAADGNGGWRLVPPSPNATYGDKGGDVSGTASCMYWGIKFMYEKYQLPIYITENGIPLIEWKTLQGTVEDPMRADYINRYFANLMKAKNEGVDIRGYYVWSLMDNFEWSSGFTRRFGLVYVDFDTMERIPKSSYYSYAALIRRHLNGGESHV